MHEVEGAARRELVEAEVGEVFDAGPEAVPPEAAARQCKQLVFRRPPALLRH